MKKHLTLITVMLLSMLFGAVLSVAAQNDRTERDIRIGERVLEELFRAEDTGQTFWRVTGGTVRGDLLPGTGIHFRVGGSGWNIALMSRDGESRRTDISREWIEERMADYFLGYASQLSGLGDDEQIRITFNTTQQEAERFFGRDSGRDELRVTGWVTVRDLNEHVAGSLSDNQLRERIEFREIEPLSSYRDLDIFAGVIETAVKSSGAEHLTITRKPGAEVLPGLGVHYRVQIRAGSGPFGTMFRVLGDQVRTPAVQIEMDSGDLRIHTDSIRVRVGELEEIARENRELLKQLRESGTLTGESTENIQREIAGLRRSLDSAQQDTVDLRPEADLILDTLREVMRDYAPTLSSLGDGDLIMVTISWAGRNPSLPATTDIRTTKEDLFFDRDWNIRERERN